MKRHAHNTFSTNKQARINATDFTTNIDDPLHIYDSLSQLIQGKDVCGAVCHIDDKLYLANNNKYGTNQNDFNAIHQTLVNHIRKLSSESTNFLFELYSKDKVIATNKHDIFKVEVFDLQYKDIFKTFKRIIQDIDDKIIKMTDKIAKNSARREHFVAANARLNQAVIESVIAPNKDNNFHTLVQNIRKDTQTIKTVDVVMSGKSSNKKDVHAEMKILQELFKDGTITNGANKQIYIGITKPCCPNCIAVIKAVNETFGTQINLELMTRTDDGHNAYFGSGIPPFLDKNPANYNMTPMQQKELQDNFLKHMRNLPGISGRQPIADLLPNRNNIKTCIKEAYKIIDENIKDQNNNQLFKLNKDGLDYPVSPTSAALLDEPNNTAQIIKQKLTTLNNYTMVQFRSHPIIIEAYERNIDSYDQFKAIVDVYEHNNNTIPGQRFSAYSHRYDQAYEYNIHDIGTISRGINHTLADNTELKFVPIISHQQTDFQQTSNLEPPAVGIYEVSNKQYISYRVDHDLENPGESILRYNVAKFTDEDVAAYEKRKIDVAGKFSTAFLSAQIVENTVEVGEVAKHDNAIYALKDYESLITSDSQHTDIYKHNAEQLLQDRIVYGNSYKQEKERIWDEIKTHTYSTIDTHTSDSKDSSFTKQELKHVVEKLGTISSRILKDGLPLKPKEKLVGKKAFDPEKNPEKILWKNKINKDNEVKNKINLLEQFSNQDMLELDKIKQTIKEKMQIDYTKTSNKEEVKHPTTNNKDKGSISI